MTRQQRPIFGFLWPRPDPRAPVDDAYVQRRLVRVAPRGPVRLTVLVVMTLLSVFLTTSAVLTALSAPLSGAAVVSSTIAATALFLSLRGWVVGTFVNDHGVVIDTVLRRVRIPWSEVSGLSCVDERVPLVGTPLRCPGRRMVVLTVRGMRDPTHVYTASPDLLGRPESFDMARDRLENWFRRA